MSVLKKSTALFLSIVIVICSMLMNIGTVLAAERNESSSVLDNDEINDFSVPELNVTVDDENKWTNDINKLKITAPVSTEIYYKTSTDKLDDWGNYTDSDAFVWDGDESENLPQGSYYIKFWAKYPGESNPVNDSVEAVHFMYDTEGPSAFKIKETKIGNDYCLVADEDITDLSGVQDIHYFIDNNSEGVYVEKIKLDGDKKVNFKIPLNSEMQSHSIKIELSDNLGNKTTVSSGKIEDADIPKINGFQVVNISDKTETKLESREFYVKTNDDGEEEKSEYTYIGNKSYLKLNIIEKNLKNVKLSIKINNNQYELNVENNKLTPPAGIKKEEYWYYISFDELYSRLKNEKQLTELTDFAIQSISVTASDKVNHQSDTLILEENGKIKTFFYDSFDSGDFNIKPVITETPVITEKDEYYFSKLHIKFNLSDDIGIASYIITVKENDDAKIDTKADKENIVKKDGNHILPSTEETTEELVFTKDGKYEINVTVTDLSGNKKTFSKVYYVDTTAPNIVEMKYEVKNGLLNYVTFGIFGVPRVEISINVNDKGCGVDPNEVKLYWNNKSYDATVDENTYTFCLDSSGKGTPYITIKDFLGNERKYNFKTINDYSENLPDEFLDEINADDSSGATLVLENDAPSYSITAEGNYKTDLSQNDENNQSEKGLYFGLQDDKIGNNKLHFTISDQENDNKFGLASYYICIKKISEDGTESEVKNIPPKNLTHQNEPILSAEEDLYVGDLESGTYRICVEAKDIAGNDAILDEDNTNFNSNNGVFYVDNEAPSISESKYTVEPSVLNYLSFGIFGNKEINISIKVNDDGKSENSFSSKVKDVTLNWGDIYKPKSVVGNTYTFVITPNYSDTPYFTVTDQIGNTNIYYFSTESIKTLKQEGELNNESGINLMLENNPPEIKVDVLTDYEKYIINGKVWYGNDIKYQVTASDIASENKYNSGLESVKTDVLNNSEAFSNYTETQFNNIDFGKESFNKQEAKYIYDINKEGLYKITADTTDNAQNSNLDVLEFNIDKNNPEITMFKFGNQDDNKPFYKHYYGYFFKKATPLKVYVNDPGVSSGIKNVEIYLNSNDKNGTSKTEITDGTSLKTDSTGTYAEILIPNNFKGTVAAKVTDNVEHTTGLISADGSVIEDDSLHKSVSSIDIKATNDTDKEDANGAPLYKTSIPLVVSVSDTHSGISKIEWSVSNDNKNGIISVDSDGKYISNSSDIVINNKSIKTDHNLLTSIDFNLVVESNTNGNEVTVKLTDNAGNSEVKKVKYSIDTTVPKITAVKSNVNSSNGNYYNTAQTVTVTITERNFNPKDVEVNVNGNVQTIDWGQDNLPSVTSDNQTHIGTFTLSEDNRYEFSIRYADMAGNRGDSFSEPEFVIDRTNPSISDNFADFGSFDDKNVFFNIKEKDKATATINVVETNFVEEDMQLKVYYKEPGSSHEDSGWSEYPLMASWNKLGDNHSITIPFTEDGVYKIDMNPVDRANNKGIFDANSSSHTAIFEVDFTAPIVYERNNDMVESGSTKFSDIYDFNRRKDENPNIVFMDTNIDRIEYSLKKYVPSYTNKKEIGTIKYEESKDTIREFVDNSDATHMIYKLQDFDKDGVYSVKMIAYDKAGNPSVLNENTYTRMVNTDVLAYIENSDSKNKTGWYSFEDENGPISKQPSSFSDLSIVVFSSNSQKNSVCLVDKDTNESTDTNITSDSKSLFDKEMYGTSVYRYTLPGSYFANNYTADADTSLYLRVVNGENILDLGEMYIDNTKPTCTVPENFSDWGWFSGSGNQTISFNDISEVLDEEKTVAYVDGKTYKVSDVKNNDVPGLHYSKSKNQIKLILNEGSHTVGLSLFDRAGNNTVIKEVHHLAIGNYRLWIIIGIVAGVAVITAIVIFTFLVFKRRKNNKK